MFENGSRRILIADNDEDVLIALERTLETEGYDTFLAFDAGGIYRTLSKSPSIWSCWTTTCQTKTALRFLPISIQ
jgi:DNA-binding NtrC family response regulator